MRSLRTVSLAASPAGEQVSQCQNRMTPDHPGTGVTHHFPGLRPHRRFVAMDRAMGTHGLFRPERATIQPGETVVEQFAAVVAQPAGRIVVAAAIDRYHRPNRPLLPVNAWRIGRHEEEAFVCVFLVAVPATAKRDVGRRPKTFSGCRHGNQKPFSGCRHGNPNRLTRRTTRQTDIGGPPRRGRVGGNRYKRPNPWRTRRPTGCRPGG